MQAYIQSPINPLFPPACNFIKIYSFSDIPPSCQWSVGIYTVITPYRAPSGVFLQEGYVPEIREISNYQELRVGMTKMTKDQWDSWNNQPDDQYILQCVTANLGLSLA